MLIIDTLTDTPGQVNEDYWGYGRSAAWVLDGATGLGKRKLLPGSSDARTYVETIHDAFREFADDPRLTLEKIVRMSIEKVRASLSKPFEDVPAYEIPSASMAFVRVKEEVFEYATLGDCKVLVQGRSGEVSALGSSPLEELDRKAIERMKELHSSGLKDYQEVRARITDMLRQHRSLMNKPGGYWTLSLSPHAADHLHSGVIEAKNLQKVLLVSDGFYDLVETFHDMTDEMLVQTAQTHGLQVLLQRLRALEKSDPDCITYPRFKPSDDATAVLIDLDRTNPLCE